MQLKRGGPRQLKLRGVYFCRSMPIDSAMPRQLGRRRLGGPFFWWETETMMIRRLANAEKLDSRSPRLALATDVSSVLPPSSLRKLPPLNALRSFEVAARHGSFTK